MYDNMCTYKPRKIKRLHTSDLLATKINIEGYRTGYHSPQSRPFVAGVLVLKASYFSCKRGKQAIKNMHIYM